MRQNASRREEVSGGLISSCRARAVVPDTAARARHDESEIVLREKGIRLLLVSNGCHRPVTWIDDGVRRQREQFLANAAEQRFLRAAGKIEAPDAAAKQHVAAEDAIRRPAIQVHHMPA